MEREELLNTNNDNGGQEQAPKKSPLLSLEKDLKFYADSIRETAKDIMVEGVSAHPIFIAHQHKVSVGEVILDREELNTNWTIQASTLEEFIEKGIINAQKKDHFLKNYKQPEKYICLFVIVPEGANFVYFPYPQHNQ